MVPFEISDQLKQKLEMATNLDEVVQFCREEGIEITIEQLKAFAQEDGAELGEDALDNVSGGAVWNSAVAGIRGVCSYLKHTRIWRYLII